MNLKEKFQDLGLLFLRIGIGLMFMYHGYGKLTGGPVIWEKLGKAMIHVGIDFSPELFGLLASLTEFGGGICLILGLYFRMACSFLFFTMTIASIKHLAGGDGLNVASHAIEAGILFFSLIFIGAGKLSLDETIRRRKNRS